MACIVVLITSLGLCYIVGCFASLNGELLSCWFVWVSWIQCTFITVALMGAIATFTMCIRIDHLNEVGREVLYAWCSCVRYYCNKQTSFTIQAIFTLEKTRKVLLLSQFMRHHMISRVELFN